MDSPIQAVDLSTLAPAERTLLAIYPDSEVAERRSRRLAGARNSTGHKAARAARWVLLGPLWSIPVERALDARAEKNAGPDVVYTTRRDFDRAGFSLPGHLKMRTLYVIHPADPNRYFPAADFHRMAFEHKFSEAVRLLVALGATNLVVEHEQGWSREMSGKIDVPVPEDKATVGLGAKGGASANSRILFEASLKGKSSAKVPDDLMWYPYEPLWQAIAQGRIDGGMDQFALTLHYKEDFGVNADLIAKAEGASIEIGGKYESHVATEWTIRGDFRRARTRRAA